MAKNDPKVSKAMPIKVDDFKLIKGIKQGIENRLHAAGIQTYSQLASLTPKEILSKLGKVNVYSIKRIEEEDWIGQAGELNSKKTRVKPRKNETARPTIRQHYENFTIEFLLDEKNVARRTRVAHVQSGDADTWADWKAERVLDFITRHAGVRVRYTRPVIPAPQKSDLFPSPSASTEQSYKVNTETISILPVEMTKEDSDLLPSFAVAGASAQIRTGEDTQPLETVSAPFSAPQDSTNPIEKIQLLEWKIFLANTDQSIRTLPHDQAFDVSLTLDLTNISLADTSKLDCVATLYAKRLGGGNRRVIGETEKTLPFENTLVLTISHLNLCKGVYRLEALVALRQAGTDVEQLPNLKAFLESGPLQVY